MDKSIVIRLYTKTMSQDSIGQFIATETYRDVFGACQSVSQTEFFTGGANGFKPELKITLFRYDYNDEQILSVDSKRYTVYRTYVGKNDTIELFCQRESGNA